MKNAMRLILCLFVTLPFVSYGLQQRPGERVNEPRPDLERVLEKYTRAVGGKAAFEKITSRVSKGAFASANLKTKGSIELYAKAPNKQLMVLLATDFGNYRRGFNGTIAWEREPGSDEALTLSGFTKRDAEFYLPIKFRETFPNIAFKGREQFGVRDADVLEAPNAGNPKRWYFDAQTGLLLRSEVRNRNAKVLESVDYGDYRAIDGVQEPFSIRRVERDGTDFDIKFGEVKHNVPIADASFDKPEQPPHDAASENSTDAKPQVHFTFGNGALKIPLDIDNNIIRMQVRVNNSKPLKFIFDTGASVSAISSQRAAELGLKAQGRVHGNATGGTIQGSFTKGVSLSVQGAEVSNQLIASFPFNTPPSFEFDGIIGCNFIARFVVVIDYQNKIMNLYNPLTYAYSGKGEVIPLLLAAGRTPLVSTKIILEGRAPVEANLEVDTGADGTFVINSPFVKKQRLLEAMSNTIQSNSNGAGGEQKLVVGRVKAAQLGRLIIDNPPVGLSQDTVGAGASEENDGLIGGEIFRRFKVILDYSRKRMILEPNKSFSEPYELDTGG